jgi:hypothetical protein
MKKQRRKNSRNVRNAAIKTFVARVFSVQCSVTAAGALSNGQGLQNSKSFFLS